MMRPFSLIMLAAALVGCGQDHGGIVTGGGDAFQLDARGISGRGAVETGLAQAQSFCGGHGRLFVLTSSQVGSDGYRLEFRCIAMNNALPPPVASAPPPAAHRSARGRRADPTSEAASSGPPLRLPASLPGMTTPPAPVVWSLGTANVPPPLPPVAATPLFAPPPGLVLAVPPLTGPRLPAPDNSALVALPRLDSTVTLERLHRPGAGSMAPAGVLAAGPTVLSREPLPPVATLPLLQPQPPGPAAAQPLAILPLATPPLATPAQPLSAPPPSFGLVVPSPNPLPGASNSLPPIASSGARQLSLPGGPPASPPGGATGFTQGFRW